MDHAELETSDRTVLIEYINQLQAKVVSLQMHIDQMAMNVISVINRPMSLDEAVWAEQYYDKEWFDRQIYSQDVKKRLAQILINGSGNYLTNPVWVGIVND